MGSRYNHVSFGFASLIVVEIEFQVVLLHPNSGLKRLAFELQDGLRFVSHDIHSLEEIQLQKI